MTTELEKKFFETFGIEPKLEEYDVILCLKSDTKPMRETRRYEFYPQITDRQLLDLYCICCKAFNLLNINSSVAFEFDVENLKNEILKRLIWVDDAYKNKYIRGKVQELFKGKK